MAEFGWLLERSISAHRNFYLALSVPGIIFAIIERKFKISGKIGRDGKPFWI